MIDCLVDSLFRNDQCVGFLKLTCTMLTQVHEQAVLVICAAIMHAVYEKRQSAKGRPSSLDQTNAGSEELTYCFSLP